MPLIDIISTASNQDELVNSLLNSDNEAMILKFIEQSVEIYRNPANEVLNIKESPQLLDYIKTIFITNALWQKYIQQILIKW